MIGFLRRWMGRGERRSLHPGDPALVGWFGSAEAASGVVVTADSAMRATAVFACVQYLARSIAAMPLILYRRLPVGLSPLDCMREAVGLALAAESYGARFYRNDARPGVILKHPGRLSPESMTRLKVSWNQNFAGVANAHRTAVLEEGMDVSTVGMTAEQAQFLETRKFQRNEIAAMFGVPPHKIGDLERATFSNIEHQASRWSPTP